MADRVRALLITPAGELLTIRRIRPGRPPYSVLPGGGIEDGENHESALARELREEIAATADVHSLLYIIDGGAERHNRGGEHLDRGGERQYCYLARVRTWSAKEADRSGPEFSDPSRGEYRVQVIPLTAEAITDINLKPDSLTRFLTTHLRQGTDLFALPDHRAANT